MNEVFGINELKANNELVRKHKYCLERELPTVVIEKILQIWAEKLKCYNPVFIFISMLVYSRNAGFIRKFFIDFDFIF